MVRKTKHSSQKAKDKSSTTYPLSMKNEPSIDLYERTEGMLTEGLDGQPLSDRTKALDAALDEALNEE